MGLLDLITGGTVAAIGDTIKKFVTTDEDRLKASAEIEMILQKRDAEIETTIRSEIEAGKEIAVAELQSGDVYTRRARPTLVYAGLFIVIWNYCLVPSVLAFMARAIPVFQVPDAFWTAWEWVTGAWVVGRSMERRGVGDAIVGKIIRK